MRSLLLASPKDDDTLRQATEAGADVLVLDTTGKEADDFARAIAFLAARRPVSVYARVSPLASGLTAAELDAIMPARPDGIVLSGAEGGASVTRLSAMLRPREAMAGVADGATAIIALATDTSAAVLALGTYRGASARLAGLACDLGRLAASLGADADALRHARAMTVLGAAAAGVPAIDGAYSGSDTPGLEVETMGARRDGFAAKIAIRPDQVATINRLLSR